MDLVTVQLLALVDTLNGKIYYLDLPNFFQTFLFMTHSKKFILHCDPVIVYIHTRKYTHTHYIHIYPRVCVCVPETEGNRSSHILNLEILYHSIEYSIAWKVEDQGLEIQHTSNF